MGITFNLIIGFLLGIGVSSFLLPMILRIAKEKKLYDIPDSRKVHEEGIPRLGGIVFVPALIFSIALLIGFNQFHIQHFHPKSDIAFLSLSNNVPFFLCALLMTYTIGMVDDLVGINYRIKFGVQILSAALLAFGNIYLRNLFGLFGIGAIPPIAGILISMLLIVYIVNAINLADGVDGLSSVITGIALLYYGLHYYFSGELILTLETFILLGAVIPFYLYNVFGTTAKNKKIFMGDTGSLSIGLILTIFGLHICSTEYPVTTVGFNPLVAGLAPLLLPCLDVFRVFAARILQGKNPFLGDRNHFHHKLLDVGLSKLMVTIVYGLYTIIIGGATLFLSRSVNVTYLLIGNLIIYFATILLLNSIIIRRGREAAKGPARAAQAL